MELYRNIYIDYDTGNVIHDITGTKEKVTAECECWFTCNIDKWENMLWGWRDVVTETLENGDTLTTRKKYYRSAKYF